jgi:hypothetical protein
MPSQSAIACTALGAMLAACGAGSQAPVPVVGGARDVQALTGQWEGWYSSAATGRNGSISFTLTARGDSAFGDVVMIPRAYGQALRPWSEPAASGAARSTHTSVLTINLVRVAAGRVTGTLAPYADPETGAQLFTRFEGALAGDKIEGTYTNTAAGAVDSQTGEWEVTRRASR